MTPHVSDLTKEIEVLRKAVARQSQELLSWMRCVAELPEPHRSSVRRNVRSELTALKVYDPSEEPG